jgi:unsaturated chondroitin disaccharide hydrolase
LSYSRIQDPVYIDIFEKLTEFFVTHLPKDLIPYWDFDFSDGSDEPRDSSCAAIAACGMLEMAKYLNAEKAELYRSLAKRLLKALTDQCAVKDKKVSNGILLHGTYCKSSPYNTCPNLGVDECVSWGDYYYMEALTRLKGDWNCYW